MPPELHISAGMLAVMQKCKSNPNTKNGSQTRTQQIIKSSSRFKGKNGFCVKTIKDSWGLSWFARAHLHLTIRKATRGQFNPPFLTLRHWSDTEHPSFYFEIFTACIREAHFISTASGLLFVIICVLLQTQRQKDAPALLNASSSQTRLQRTKNNNIKGNSIEVCCPREGRFLLVKNHIVCWT